MSTIISLTFDLFYLLIIAFRCVQRYTGHLVGVSCWQVRDILYGNDALDESQMTLSNRFIEHSLFVQLDVLCHFDEDDSIGWKEMARCV